MGKVNRDKAIRLLLRSLPIPLIPGPELYDLVVDLRSSRTEVEEKVEQALTSLRDASQLVAELEETLQERTEKLEALRAEVDRMSELAAVEEEKAAPLLKELKELTDRGKGRERVIAFAINIVAGLIIFALGTLFGPRLFPGDAAPQTATSVVAPPDSVAASPDSVEPGASVPQNPPLQADSTR